MGEEREEILTRHPVHDVVVIGAGPAGSLTAALLARDGHDVLVLEEHDVVGSPVHCTGLLGADAFQQFDLPRSLILGYAGTARFWGAAGQSVPIDSDRIRATIIDRGEFDRTLAERAAAAGARVRTGAHVERLAVNDDGVSVVVRGEALPIRARAAVLACGANYRFHRPLGLGMPRVFLQSAQLDAPFPQAAEVEVRFGRDVAPGGFAWLVPFTRDGASRARIGVMCETRATERFRTFVQALAADVGIDAGSIARPRPKMLPLGPIARTYAHRVVAVGDAAGLVKPTTGGGIYYGLISGSLAATVLSDGLRRDRLAAAHLRPYELSWQKQLGAEIRMGLTFRKLAAGLNDQSIDALIDVARKGGGVVPLLRETASFNWHRKAAIALLGHPSVRKVILGSGARAASSLSLR